MRSVIVVVFFIYVSNKDIETVASSGNGSCGIDNSPVSTVYEGAKAVETYPWMGVLYYPMGKKRFITTVVLVTKQMVIATANEIDKLPKVDFRARTRVVLGRQCGQKEIRIRDYTFHPEYDKNTFSALAMVQLEVDHLRLELRPICPPPSHFVNPQFYAMTMTEGCSKLKVKIYRMEYVNINRCQNFYRRSGLGQNILWPTHTACAKAISGGRCLWRSGTVLAVKQDGRWRLLGFSVYGPGCGAPARFLDYGMYHRWVRSSVSNIGQPAISRLGDNHVVLRRSLSNVQRYGPCDPEETDTEIYSDRVTIVYRRGHGKSRYNVSLYANVEYSCVTFKAKNLENEDYKRLNMEKPFHLTYIEPEEPKIRVQRWCSTPTHMCYGFQFLVVQFYVDITFSTSLEFQVNVYGKTAKIISAAAAIKYSNARKKRPIIPWYPALLQKLRVWEGSHKHKWFYKTME